MRLKKCNKCLIEKPVSDFGIEARAKNGYKPRCKKCLNEYYNSMYGNYKSKKIAKARVDYIKNKAAILARVNEYQIRNSDKIRDRKKSYAKLNRVKVNQSALKLHRLKMATDPEYRAKRALRKLIERLKVNKRQKTVEQLGYSVIELKERLGRLPEKHESLDHKVPVSWFVSSTNPSIIHHLDNLQILTSSENSRKNNTWSDPIPIDYYHLVKNNIIPNKLNLIPIIK